MSCTFKRLRKRKDGTSYEVWVCEDEWEGMHKTITGKTEREVKSKMKTWLREMALYGEALAKTKDSFGNYFNKYLFDVVLNEVESSTFTRYKGIYDNYIRNSKLALMRLDAIKYEDIQHFFNELTKLSSASMNKTKCLLNGCFKYAKKNNLIRNNPLEDFSVPKSKKRKKEMRVMTIEEQARYIKALENSALRLPLLLTMFTGIRLGELIALTWDDVDLETSMLRINKSLKRTNVYDKNGSYEKKDVVKTTKTNRSRGVPIPGFILEELKTMPHDTKYVFETSTNNHYSSDNIRREHIKICTAAKIGKPTVRKYRRSYKHKDLTSKTVVLEKVEYLDINFHALRHTYATRLFNYGESAKMIQSLLGHTKLSTTMDIYTHVLDVDKKQVTDKLLKLYDDLS